MYSDKSKTISRVLIADDDPVIRHWLSSILEGEGYSVVSTSDGRDAYRLLQSDANFAGAVFDMSMPFLEGSDLIRFMRTEKRLMRIPVMLITAESDIRLVASGFAAGASVLLPKPFTRKRLQQTLRIMLGAPPVLREVSRPTSLPTSTRKVSAEPSEDKLRVSLPSAETTAATENHDAVPAAPVDLSLLASLEDDDGCMDDNLVVELIDLYLENGTRQLTEIKAAIGRKDERSLKHLAHALKGSSLTMGASDVAHLCAELEQENKQPTVGIAELAQKLETAFAYAGEIFRGERQKRVTPVAA